MPYSNSMKRDNTYSIQTSTSFNMVFISQDRLAFLTANNSTVK